MPASLSFPPIGAVAQQQYNNDEWSYDNQWGNLFQVVKNKKFTKTSILDHAFRFGENVELKNKFEAFESDEEEEEIDSVGTASKICENSKSF